MAKAAMASPSLVTMLKSNLIQVQTEGNFKDMITIEVNSMTIAVEASEPYSSYGSVNSSSPAGAIVGVLVAVAGLLAAWRWRTNPPFQHQCRRRMKICCGVRDLACDTRSRVKECQASSL